MSHSGSTALRRRTAASPGARRRGKPQTAKKAGPWSRLPTALRRLIVFIVIIGAWQAYVSLAHVSPLVFASPWSVAKALVSGWGSGTIALSTGITIKVLAIGMGIGILGTLVFTALSVTTRVGEDLFAMLSSMINPLPSVAILPLAILWFGLNQTALVFVVANAVLWPMTISVAMGFRTVPATTMMVGRNLGLRGWRLVRDVLMPSALPHTIAGFKTGWAFGWRTVIAAELVFGVAGAHGGLGFFINNARYHLQIPDVFAGLVTIALIGIILDVVFNRIEQHTVVRWGMKEGSPA